jgi:hypothetical protein
VWLWPVSRKCVCIHLGTEDKFNNGTVRDPVTMWSAQLWNTYKLTSLPLYFVPLHSDYKIHTGCHTAAYGITLHTLVESTIWHWNDYINKTNGFYFNVCTVHLFNVFISTNQWTNTYHNSIFLYNVHSYMFWHFYVIFIVLQLCLTKLHKILKTEAVNP